MEPMVPLVIHLEFKERNDLGLSREVAPNLAEVS